jgi:GT2 family glycosyltransferase
MDDIGAFNASAFGRGYGEENDFCLRATARGWRNVAACDVFVRHTVRSRSRTTGRMRGAWRQPRC